MTEKSRAAAIQQLHEQRLATAPPVVAAYLENARALMKEPTKRGLARVGVSVDGPELDLLAGIAAMEVVVRSPTYIERILKLAKSTNRTSETEEWFVNNGDVESTAAAMTRVWHPEERGHAERAREIDLDLFAVSYAGKAVLVVHGVPDADNLKERIFLEKAGTEQRGAVIKTLVASGMSSAGAERLIRRDRTGV